ncbi:MAG: hypothetical protein JRJ84_22305 [Deltaproteobacteria bacterium]|nr:hypothetical protein [Deltaproteobacteria bacterium]
MLVISLSILAFVTLAALVLLDDSLWRDRAASVVEEALARVDREWAAVGLFVLILVASSWARLRAAPAGLPYLHFAEEGALLSLFDIGEVSSHLWLRRVNGVVGVAAVGVTYVLARGVAGRWGAVFSAAFLGGFALHAGHSARVTLCAPASLLVALLALLALRALPGRARSSLALALGCVLALTLGWVWPPREVLCILSPWVAVGAGWTTVVVHRSFLLRRAGRVGVLVGGGWVVAAVGLATWMVSASVIQAPRTGDPDTRSQLVDRLNDKKRHAYGISEELQLHEDDRRRLRSSIEVQPIDQLMCGPRLKRVAVPAGFDTRIDPERAALLQTFLPPWRNPRPTPERHRRTIRLGDVGPDPTIRLVRNRPLPYGCMERIGVEQLESEPSLLDAEGGRVLSMNGMVRTPYIWLPAGRYEATWEVRGDAALGVYPQVFFHSRTHDRELAKQKTFLTGEWTRYPFPFEVDHGDTVSVALHFLNDAWTETEDRNVQIRAFALAPVRDAE